jgi:acetyltransferase-like isoleucine patch superfamily enzyme
MPIAVRIRNAARQALLRVHVAVLRKVWGMDIGRDCKISFKALIDRTHPRGVHIGDYTGVAFGAVVLSHDFLNGRHVHTYIGSRCHIGANAIIYPGVTIGDGSIVSAGSVVTRSVPEGSLVMGNPARVVEKDLRTGKWGIRIDTIPEDRLDKDVIVGAREVES